LRGAFARLGITTSNEAPGLCGPAERMRRFHPVQAGPDKQVAEELNTKKLNTKG
jgi:hypothetical protein